VRGRVALGVASLLGLAFGWAGFFGARQPIVARVADWRLGVGDLETEIAARSADGGGQYGTLEARASLVRALVERKMLAGAARRAGFADAIAAGVVLGLARTLRRRARAPKGPR